MKLVLILANLSVLFAQLGAQELPDKIRGYKVYDAKVSVANSTTTRPKPDKSDAFVKLTDPTMPKVGLLGASVDISAEITAGQIGEIEFMTFHDFRVGGITVEIDEYRHQFSFKKEVAVRLPQPIRGSIGMLSLPGAAYNEVFGSSDDLAVTGTVFVFGKFKKFGISFKRVIPVRIDLKIKNPLRS